MHEVIRNAVKRLDHSLKMRDHLCDLNTEKNNNIRCRERDHWGDPDVDGRIIFRWIFRKWEGIMGTGWSWFRIGTGGGYL
jgi:hypothetical protein